jgi:hypothetical protein
MLHARIARIDDDHVPRLRRWLAALPERRAELEQSYRTHGTRHELFLLVGGRRQTLLVVIAETASNDVAAESFLHSQLPIDLEFKALVQEISFEEAAVELLYDSSRLLPVPGT